MRLRVKYKTKGRDDGVTSDCDSDSDSDHENERGRTVLSAVRKAIENGVKIPLEWNAAKVPCGEHRTTFGTYLGVIAREQVNINYEKWKHIPAELKNEVYNDITRGFIVLPDRRGWVLSRASERWRAFKSRLVRKYLYKTPGKIRKKAPSKYPFILQNDWEKFIAYCTSDKFKETSEKNRARGKMNTSKYRGGRQGYQHFEEEIAKDFEAQGIHVEKVPRHLTWLKAHENKADESYAPADLEIAEAIKTLDAQARKGGIATAGRDDILAKVMQKPEHGGRVRAVGSGITNKEYFGPADRPKYSQMLEEIRGLRSQVDQMATTHNSMVAYLMACSQQPASQQTASQFSQEKLRQFMIHGSGLGFGLSSDVDGQFGVSGGHLGGFGQFSQSGGVGQFANMRQCGTGYQSGNVPKSPISSEPGHDPEPGTSYDSEPGTSYDSEPGTGYTSEPEADHSPQLETGYVSEPETDHIPQPETGHLPQLETDLVPRPETDRVPEPETNLNTVSEEGHVPKSETNHRTLLEAGHVPVPETDHIPVSEHFVGAPPTYSTANIKEVRDSWIHYIFQHKQAN